MSAGLMKNTTWNVPFCILRSSLNLESYGEPTDGSLKALYLPLNSLLDSEKPRNKKDVCYLFLWLESLKEFVLSKLLIPPNKTHHVHTLEIQQELFFG